MKIKSIFAALLLFALTLAACGAKPSSETPAPAIDTVGTAVAAALTAVPPRPTYTPYPTATPYPTPDLSGLFCEYEFCIGHPAGFPLFDLEVVNDYTANRSGYAQGILIGFDGNLYIFLSWSQVAGQFDPGVMLAAALQTDVPQEVRITEDINGRPVTYVLLQTTPSPVVPFGLVAAWQCGDRQFGWKIYTAQDGQGIEYLWQALGSFRCDAP
jgi:hypothetical protein